MAAKGCPSRKARLETRGPEFPSLGKSWAEKFQALENGARIFPRLGKVDAASGHISNATGGRVYERQGCPDGGATIGAVRSPAVRRALCGVTMEKTMKSIGAVLCGLMLALAAAAAGRPFDSAHGRPNLVIILADDLGYGEPG